MEPTKRYSVKEVRRKMSHREYLDFAESVDNSIKPCEARHLTFGGRCLNCGHDPEKIYRFMERNKE